MRLGTGICEKGYRYEVTKASRGTFVPLVFAPGEAFQFDWSEAWVVIGGERTKRQEAQVKLCHSRAFMLRAYRLLTHEMLFDAHTHCLAALGGVPQRGIYDNMKTAVDRVGRGKARVVNSRFKAMASHFLFEAEFCSPGAVREKGQVEHHLCTIAQSWHDEQSQLMHMPPPFDGFIEHTKRVSTACLITFERNRYSAPASFANRPVGVRIYAERIVITAEDQLVAEHPRAFVHGHDQPGRTVYDWHHYLSVIARKPGALRNGAPFAERPEAFKQLHPVLLKRPGGDREMVEILALVLHHDEQAVLCAVELALEAGGVSKQHVLNILSRLLEASPPSLVETPEGLTLLDEPKADVHRYDHLRGDHYAL